MAAPQRVHLDFETRSPVDLRRCGAARYAQDPETEVLCACYSFDDGDTVRSWSIGKPPPADLIEAVAAGAAPRELGELQTVLSAARISQAFARDWLDDSAGALALALDEEARLAALDAPLRAAMEFEPRIGRAANQAGDSLFFLNRFDEALAAYRRAQQHYAQALQARPEDRRLIDSLAVSRWSSSLKSPERFSVR